MRLYDGMEEVKIVAPGPKVCPICATRHIKNAPHDRDSLYYQNHFRKTHKRFPTWEDAMEHCTEATKSAFRKELEKRGISVDAPTAEELKNGQ